MLKIQLNLHIKETKKNGRKLEQKLIRLRSNNCLIKSLVRRTNQFLAAFLYSKPDLILCIENVNYSTTLALKILIF